MKKKRNQKRKNILTIVILILIIPGLFFGQWFNFLQIKEARAAEVNIDSTTHSTGSSHSGSTPTVVFKFNHNLISVSVISIYIVGLFVVAFGAESFLRIHRGRSKLSLVLLFLGTAVSLSMILAFIYNPSLLSFEIDSPVPYIYTFVLILVAYVSLSRVIQIKNLVSIVKDLSGSLMLSYVLIIVVAAVEIHYDLLEQVGLERYQITYLAHFIFFAALSISFLSFAKVRKLGGVYADVEKALETQAK